MTAPTAARPPQPLRSAQVGEPLSSRDERKIRALGTAVGLAFGAALVWWLFQ